MTFVNVDPIEEPIPVYPTAHYTMGGIPTNRFGQVVAPLKQSAEEVIPGLYAAGECACVSVHGANRLGGNSLLDIVVFGRAAGNHIIDYLKTNRYHRPLNKDSVDKAMQRLLRWDDTSDGEPITAIRDDLQREMETHCGVFRTEDVLKEGVEKIQAIQARMANARLTDHSKIFNTARIEALELENLVEVALATVHSAYARQESRGRTAGWIFRKGMTKTG